MIKTYLSWDVRVDAFQSVWGFGMDIHTGVFKMSNQQGPPGWLREVFSVLCGSLDGRGVWGRMDPCIWIGESLHYSPETTTALLIGSTPIQTKKFKKKICSPV